MTILEQLFEQNFATKIINLTDTVSATVKNISMQDQIAVEKAVLKFESGMSKALFIHQYGIEVLKHTLLEFKGVKFSTLEEVEKQILQMSPYVLNKLISEQNLLEKEIRLAVTPEAIEESFFEAPLSPEKQEQSREGFPLQEQTN